MVLHRALGARRVALLDRGQQRVVLLHHRRVHDRAGQLLATATAGAPRRPSRSGPRASGCRRPRRPSGAPRRRPRPAPRGRRLGGLLGRTAARSAATVSASGRWAARPASGTSSTIRASSSSSSEADPVSSIIAMASLRLRLMPCSAVCATKIPPPGPLVARIRLPLVSSLSPSRRVGRLTPSSSERSPSRPRKSPGWRPSASMWCWMRAAMSSLAAPMVPGEAARACGARRPCSRRRPPGHPVVHDPARLALRPGEEAGVDRHHAHAQAEPLAHDAPAGGELRRRAPARPPA